MGLPRPLNWLREPSVDEEQIEEVKRAAQAVKQALDEAQEALSQMESDNADQVDALNRNLSEAMSNIIGQSGGAPSRMFIVYQWWGFAEQAASSLEESGLENAEEIAARIRSERYRAVPFRSAEMAASYLNSNIELLQAIANSVVDLVPEQVEETPDDVLTRVILRDNDNNQIGFIELKYWQYNPNQEVPEEAGGGTGDWV
jgi:uncharacterized protein (DUF3084 family)|tara:strand:- start:117 stop:719 length:603 start_codon:yes stop_codon:yes gene_type:complete